MTYHCIIAQRRLRAKITAVFKRIAISERGTVNLRTSGQESEICSTMVCMDDRTGPRPIARFSEKNLYFPAQTCTDLLQTPKLDFYRRAVDICLRAVDICLRAVDICRIWSQQNAASDIPVTNTRPNILSREKKNLLEKDDIGRLWSTSDTLSIPFPPSASSPAAHTTGRGAHGRPGNAHAAAIPPHFGAPTVAQPVGSRFCGGI